MPIPADGSKLYIRTTGGLDKEVQGLIEFDSLGGERAEKDRTTLADTTDRKFALGKKDNGSLSVSMFGEDGDAGQVELDAAYDDGESRLITWEKPDGKAKQFTGLIKGFTDSDGVAQDDDIKRTATIRISGAISNLASFTPVTV